MIGGNGSISEGQQQQIHDLYIGLKEIAATSELITDRQFLSKHSNVLKDSPPARSYETNSHEFLFRLPIINLLPLLLLLFIYYSLYLSAEADFRFILLHKRFLHFDPWLFDIV